MHLPEAAPAPRDAALTAAILVALAVTGGAAASEADARATVDRFFVAWNAADNAALAEVLHLPHVFLVGEGEVRVARTAADIEVDFAALRSREGWARSTLDAAETTYVSTDRVHLELVFSRLDANGDVYRRLAALWIATRRDGRWGVQVRSILGAPDTTDDEAGAAAADEAADAFITAWNTASDDALRSTVQFPFVSLFGDRLIVAAEPGDLTTDFEQLRRDQGWQRSSFDSFTALRATPSKVHAAVDFSRYRADGSRYAGGRMLYVFTRRDGRWGMQLRTSMASEEPGDE